MKRLLLVFTLLVILGVAALAAFGWWAVATNAGTRWLLQTIAEVADMELRTEVLEGALIEDLLVEGVEVRWTEGQVLIGRLKLDIGALELMRGRISIEALEVDDLSLALADEEDESPESAQGPEVTAATDSALDVLPAWLDLELERLAVTNFIYHEFDDPTDQVVIAELIAGRYHLSGQRLVAQGFAYHSPYVQLDGDFDWELTRPHLVMQVDVYLPETTADPELFETLRLPLAFPAQLELDGDWDGYAGPVRFGRVDAEGDSVWLTSDVAGSWQGIRLANLSGRYLQGELAGDLDLAWIDDYRMHGSLAGTALAPAVLVEELDGPLSLDMAGELVVPYDDRPMTSNFSAENLKVHLHGHEIQGRVAGESVETSVVSLDVDLNSESAWLLASGAVEERVEVDVAIDELADFAPDLGGTLAAQGWVRLQNGSLTGEVAGQGSELSWMDGAAETVSFTGRHLQPDAAIEVELTGADWYYQEWHVTRAEAELSGDRTSHRLQVVAEGELGRFELRVTGKQQDEDWSGVLERFVGSETRWGNWSTTAPTRMAWQDGAFSIADFNLQNQTGSQIALSMEHRESEETSRVDLSWQLLELDWLETELGDIPFAGGTEGKLHYEQVESQPVLLEGQIKANGKVEEEAFEFVIEELAADLTWNSDGLQLSAKAQSQGGEFVQAQATSQQPPRWSWPPVDLQTDIEIQRLNLQRLNRFIDDARLEGLADATLLLEISDSRPVRVKGQVRADARLLQDGRELGPRTLATDLDWDDDRLECTTVVTGMHGGMATLRLTSKEDLDSPWPDSGVISLEIEDLNLAVLEPFLPEDLDLVGKFVGSADGRWRNREQLVLAGRLELNESELRWVGEDGQVRLPIRNAVADWRWEGDSMNGSWGLNLDEYGFLRGEWQLPLAARIPVQIDPDGPLQIGAEGRMQFLGILSTSGSWMTQNLGGELTADLNLAGTLNQPKLQGNVRFDNGSAYLPVAGIQVEDLQLHAELSDSRIRIADLRLRSGPGELTSQGELLFDRWQLTEFRVTLAGERLQLIDFPEVRLLIDPDLTLVGTPGTLSVQGTVRVPELAIQGNMERPKFQVSEDVVIVSDESEDEVLPFKTDIQVKVELGEQVTLRTAGVDTRFGGGATVTMNPEGRLLATGEIQLVSGSYNAHGARLQIRQGLLRYTNTPIINPTLRIFAARKVGAVLAGVQVTGTAEAPVVTLYSRPAMPERDVLGYILMGRAVRADRQESDMLAMGAGALLPQYGGGLEKLGVTEIDVQGLFESEGGGGIRLRHRLAEKWEVESTLGAESGIDLFYIIEFE